MSSVPDQIKNDLLQLKKKYYKLTNSFALSVLFDTFIEASLKMIDKHEFRSDIWKNDLNVDTCMHLIKVKNGRCMELIRKNKTSKEKEKIKREIRNEIFDIINYVVFSIWLIENDKIDGI